jgi:heat shock protein HtpX
VVILGRPNFLASALTRIGFTQLYYERYSPRARFLDWLRFDPHPPIYFRVKRLSRMAEKGGKISHTLLVSIRDCISGFFGALAGL